MVRAALEALPELFSVKLSDDGLELPPRLALREIGHVVVGGGHLHQPLRWGGEKLDKSRVYKHLQAGVMQYEETNYSRIDKRKSKQTLHIQMEVSTYALCR